MRVLRSERIAAALLLGAAALGVILANTALRGPLTDARAAGLSLAGLHLSVGDLISDGLLAVFFFIVAIELKHELVAGELNSFSKALHPAVAAVGGVLVPALIYLAIAAPAGYPRGWPIPTATDIAFALGVLAMFGRGLPPRIRVFLLALAVLDDLIAIIIIAVVFAHDPNPLLLVAAAACVAAFGALSYARRRWMRVPATALMIALALAAWVLVFESGVHATIAGVALGLAMRGGLAERVRHAIEPWSNAVILPLFAFSSALVPIPAVSPAELPAPFWAIMIALPVGKLVGITVGGSVGSVFVRRREGASPLTLRAIITIAALGGIGFTVSLLMNELAFSSASVRDDGTLAVLAGSLISIVVSAFLVRALTRRTRPRAGL